MQRPGQDPVAKDDVPWWMKYAGRGLGTVGSISERLLISHRSQLSSPSCTSFDISTRLACARARSMHAARVKYHYLFNHPIRGKKIIFLSYFRAMCASPLNPFMSMYICEHILVHIDLYISLVRSYRLQVFFLNET